MSYNCRMNTIQVQMLPQFLDGVDLSRSVAVVIDVLRASSTIVHALGNGASCVIPCETVEEARALAVRSEDRVILGGERQGQRIDGFDLDNSPAAYGETVVAGRTILFTTTNGTRALQRCTAADVVLVGAFVNQSAIVRHLCRLDRDVHLVCAGTDGQLTAEDILFAGAVVVDLLDQCGDRFAFEGVPSQMAADFYRARSVDEATFRRTMFDSLGGRNLVALGMAADIERCLQRDLFDLVPKWDRRSGKLIPVSASGEFGLDH